MCGASSEAKGPDQNISPGGVSTFPWSLDKLGEMCYGDNIESSRLLTRSKHAGLVPIPPGYNTYAVVVRATPPEFGDTAV